MNNTTNASGFSEDTLQNLFLLPRNFSISCESAEVHTLLQASRIFHNLHEVEMGIRPILIQMEDRGVLLSDELVRRGDALDNASNYAGC